MPQLSRHCLPQQGNTGALWLLSLLLSSLDWGGVGRWELERERRRSGSPSLRSAACPHTPTSPSCLRLSAILPLPCRKKLKQLECGRAGADKVRMGGEGGRWQPLRKRWVSSLSAAALCSPPRSGSAQHLAVREGKAYVKRAS